MATSVPDYSGGGLVNLVAELEARLAGSAPSPTLDPSLASRIPDADTYVLVLFDGLGDDQLEHPAARPLSTARAGALDAPFASTTTVSLATVATGLPPLRHGVIGHLLWLPEVGSVVNTLKWVDLGGHPVAYPTSDLLPSPNLWERLADAGVEAVTVQPEGFADTPLTSALYRGCRFEGYGTIEEAVEATVLAARRPRRLVFTYFPEVDFAAHVWGRRSGEYAQALSGATRAWLDIATRVSPGVVVCGTADHGMIDYPDDAKMIVRDPWVRELTLYGDPRAVYAKGDEESIERLATLTGAKTLWGEDAEPLWGDGDPHHLFEERRPDAVLLAPPGRLILPPGFDKRLVGYHGGLEPAERMVPLLVTPTG
ncbi:MAG: alkaline phosphatase family protein [Acidimicrobiia bacterium]|nr:MAG: alkaline phosphatase family protein [Acidimicrobiia bacterium]